MPSISAKPTASTTKTRGPSFSTPDTSHHTTPGIALKTETTLADISQEIDIKQINYLLKQVNRGTNEHIRSSIWERKINTVCTH